MSSSYPYSYHRTEQDQYGYEEYERLNAPRARDMSRGPSHDHSEPYTAPYELRPMPQSPYNDDRNQDASSSTLRGTGDETNVSTSYIQSPPESWTPVYTMNSPPVPPPIQYRPAGQGPPYSSPDLDSLLDAPGVSTSGGNIEKGYARKPVPQRLESDEITIAEVTKGKGKGLLSPFGEKFSPLIGSLGNKNVLKPEEIIHKRSELTAVWGVHWYLPTLMITVFIFGVVGAVGHHAFYKSLHGKMAQNQLTMVRYGTAFAFFVKAALVGSIVIAYRQRIWYTMRRKGMSLRAIDSMFGVIEDPTMFLTFEMVRKAKIATLLALASWVVPIASVLSPSALTSELREVTVSRARVVPTLEFIKEDSYDFLTPGLGYSLAFYNQSKPTDPISYDMPSTFARRIATQSVFNHGPLSPDSSPCVGYNCTYAVDFDAPGYKCVDVEDDEVLKRRAPFKHSKLAPEGKLIYYADVDRGDFKKPNLPPPKSKDPDWTVGTFLHEPELWIGYSILTRERLPPDHKFVIQNRWNFTMIPKIFNCQLYHTRYFVNVTYLNEAQNATVERVIYDRPAITTFAEEESPDPEKFIRPGQTGYRLLSAYHALGALMRVYLGGEIEYQNGTAFPITRSDISMTNLMRKNSAFPLEDLPRAVERFFQDIVISLWSDLDMEATTNTTINVTMSNMENLFQYYEQGLWLGYSIAVGVAFLACIVGATSLHGNGISSDTLFSRIMVTTRNPTLDRLARGACLGSDPFPRELELTEFRFGALDQGDGQGHVSGLGVSGIGSRVGHCAFGTVAETGPIVKGEMYAGLRDIYEPGKKHECTCECVDGIQREDSQGCDQRQGQRGATADKDEDGDDEWFDSNDGSHAGENTPLMQMALR